MLRTLSRSAGGVSRASVTDTEAFFLFREFLWSGRVVDRGSVPPDLCASRWGISAACPVGSSVVVPLPAKLCPPFIPPNSVQIRDSCFSLPVCEVCPLDAAVKQRRPDLERVRQCVHACSFVAAVRLKRCILACMCVCACSCGYVWVCKSLHMCVWVFMRYRAEIKLLQLRVKSPRCIKAFWECLNKEHIHYFCRSISTER